MIRPALKYKPRCGSAVHTAKLSVVDVLAIRSAYQAKAGTYRSLAQRFGVTKMTICNIVKRKSWKHVSSVSLDESAEI